MRKIIFFAEYDCKNMAQFTKAVHKDLNLFAMANEIGDFLAG
jgi:hypothetical protein